MRLILLLVTLIIFPSYCLSGELFTYLVGDKKYEGYLVKSSTDAPFVLLLHDWDGLTEYEIKRAEMLGQIGYNVLAADLFGKNIRPTEVKDKKQHTGQLYKDRSKFRKLLHGALSTASDKGFDLENSVAMGYCFGGAAVLELARSGADLKGFVTFHGGLATPDGQDYLATTGKLLILHGAADGIISMEQFGDLADELEEYGIDHEMITYGGAPHAFTVFGSKAYRKNADEKSWQRFTQFLQETL